MAQLTTRRDEASEAWRGASDSELPDADLTRFSAAPELVAPVLRPAPRRARALRWLHIGLLVSLMLVALAVALAPMAHAATYKWVDDKGVVHYTDKLPAEMVDKGNIELNKQGLPIKKVDPAPSLEQRKAKEAEIERERQFAKDHEQMDRRDRALMQSYTMESEIDLAKTRALATIDTQVQSSMAYSQQLSKRRTELEANKKALGNKPVPPALERELESTNDELAKQEVFLAARRQEIAAVTARYDGDRQRWRELRAIADANAAAAAANPTSAPAPAVAPGKSAAGPTARK